jgi:hypothetical protein
MDASRSNTRGGVAEAAATIARAIAANKPRRAASKSAPMETSVQLPPPVLLPRARTDRALFRPEPELDRGGDRGLIKPAGRKARSVRAVWLGLVVMLAQLFVAVVLLAPEGPLWYRYSTLIQHDSYWFANIIDRGYDSILPPISRKMMEVSNVAFFPAYPMLAAGVQKAFGLSTYTSLLIVAQAAAWAFWSYFFLFCERWKLSPRLQFLGALAIAAHPTAFYLVTGYSESLFLMALLGFIFWSGVKGTKAKFIAAAHGIVMSGTRIVGIPCAGYPVVREVFTGGWAKVRNVWGWLRNYAGAAVLTAVSTLGAIAFFVYCHLRWGVWNLYMLTQEAGWNVHADYLAVFKLESYRWFLPSLHNATEASQMTMTLGALVFVAVAAVELVAARKRVSGWQARVGLYFCAFITYYIAVSGVASVGMESMLRYQFCAHVLIVLAFLHFLTQVPPPPKSVRAFGIGAAALLCAASLALQGWYVWVFTRGGWVA